ncbi:MAG: hypothetical protein COB02_08600 [Candidatus Cloacimonadota bacterium]|nr:MAG: hypothetical protein COB02_08600 [Candidatus Cloacimonadota bacterium]
MKNLLIKFTVIQVLSLCFSASVIADSVIDETSPSVTTIIQSDQGNSALSDTLDVSKLTAETVSTTDFNYRVLIDDEDAATTAFEEFLNNSANSGLSIDFLKQFDKRSLKILKEDFFDLESSKGLWKKLEDKGVSVKKLDEVRLDMLSKSVRDEYLRLKKEAEALQELISNSDSNNESVQEELNSLKTELLAKQQKRDGYFQSELDKLKLNLSMIDKSMGINWFGNKYDDWAHLLSQVDTILDDLKEISVEKGAKTIDVKNEKGETKKVSLFQELQNRLSYIQRFASKTDSDTFKIGSKTYNKKGVRAGVTLVISWYFTKENVNKLLIQKAQEPKDDGVSTTGWTEESKALYIYMADKLNKREDFTLSVKTTVTQTLVGMVTKYNTMVKKVNVPELETLLTGSLSKNIERFLKDKKLTPDSYKEISNWQREYKIYLEQMKVAKNAKESDLAKLKVFLKENNIDENYIEKWVNVKSAHSIIEKLAKSGISKTKIDYFIRDLKSYTQNGITEAMSAARAWDTYTKIKSKYLETVGEANKRAQELIDWVIKFDKKRENVEDKSLYGKLLSEMFVFIRDEKGDKVEMINTAFAKGYSECLDLFTLYSLDQLKMTTGSYPKPLADSRVIRKIDTINKTRQVCFAAYEWRLKERLAKGENDYIFSQTSAPIQNAYGYSIATIIKSMGKSAESIKVASNTDHSIYEGFTDLMEFIKNIRYWVVRILIKEFKDKGIVVDGGLSEDQSDNINFTIPNGSILFAQGSHKLSAIGKETLDKYVPQLLEVLGDYGSILSNVDIEGHTNSDGGAKYDNIGLSRRRAITVQKYCNVAIKAFKAKAQGVKVEAIAKGPLELIFKDVSGKKVEDKVASRRVVIKFALDKAKIANIKSNDSELLKLRDKIKLHFPNFETLGAK